MKKIKRLRFTVYSPEFTNFWNQSLHPDICSMVALHIIFFLKPNIWLLFSEDIYLTHKIARFGLPSPHFVLQLFWWCKICQEKWIRDQFSYVKLVNYRLSSSRRSLMDKIALWHLQLILRAYFPDFKGRLSKSRKLWRVNSEEFE